MCLLVVFFFSSRRLHTRCALVTGVQTCALPIYGDELGEAAHADCRGVAPDAQEALEVGDAIRRGLDMAVEEHGGRTEPGGVPGADDFLPALDGRSEERRVGKAWVSTCRARWSPSH